jgi:hypothetical protein
MIRRVDWGCILWFGIDMVIIVGAVYLLIEVI